MTTELNDQRFCLGSAYAREVGLNPRHFMSLRSRHPDAWPKEVIRANTKFYARRRDWAAFLSECARRDAEQPERFAEYGRKGGQRRART